MPPRRGFVRFWVVTIIKILTTKTLRAQIFTKKSRFLVQNRHLLCSDEPEVCGGFISNRITRGFIKMRDFTKPRHDEKHS